VSEFVPVVFLAFSDDRDSHLPMIAAERREIFHALQDFDDRNFIKVLKEEGASINALFETCNRYRDRIAIFHYGGHADGTRLQLQASSGAAESAGAAGLAQLLGLQKSLQLVFLNGCATLDQVRVLFAAGVKAVIATSVPVSDGMAKEFAQQFYHALAKRATIQEAFRTAKAYVATRYGNAREVEEFRALHWAASDAKPKELPWGLYVNPDLPAQGALAWMLPKVSEHQVIVRGAVVAPDAGGKLNVHLVQALFNAVAQHSAEVAAFWEAAKVAKRQDLRMVRQQIFDAYPTPIGEQLRKLFAGNSIDEDRLRQLLFTYETLLQLICYVLLSQLWDKRLADAALPLGEDRVVRCRSFFSLSADTQPTFDYVTLIAAVLAFLTENGVELFFPELASLDAEWRKQELVAAHAFMEEMRAELARGRVTANEIKSFCLQAETHLTAIMVSAAFVVRYKLATVKRIDFIKSRGQPAEYRHTQVILDRVSAGLMAVSEVYPTYAESDAIILLKRTDDIQDFLSLAPFVIDENSLSLDPNSAKVHFFSHFGPSGDSYVFRSIAAPQDLLTVPAAAASDEDAERQSVEARLKAQFEEFKRVVCA